MSEPRSIDEDVGRAVKIKRGRTANAPRCYAALGFAACCTETSASQFPLPILRERITATSLTGRNTVATLKAVPMF